jgi:hypothetical protein
VPDSCGPEIPVTHEQGNNMPGVIAESPRREGDTRIVPAGRDDGQPSARLTNVGWTPVREIELHEWLDQGRRFGAMGRGAGWWIGDWLNYGNLRYGERYARAARITGYDAQTLMNMVYVASRFEISRRREMLTFSHHAEVAALLPAEQDRWLERAERERLSVHCFREELRCATGPTRKREADRSASAGPGSAHRATSLDDSAAFVCPKCGHEFSIGP